MMEYYFDNLFVKSRNKINHLEHLEILFNKLRKHQLKMNPLKWTFRFTSGKFLGFALHHQGVNFDLAKIKANIEFPPLKNLGELKALQGRLAYIAGSPPICLGDANPSLASWKRMCHSSEMNKQHSTKSKHTPWLLLCSPVPPKKTPCAIYATLDLSFDALLAQVNTEGKENTFLQQFFHMLSH